MSDPFGIDHDHSQTAWQNIEIMQSTGLQDKNRVSIFEGDIVEDHIGKGFVEYVEKYAGFRVNYRDGKCKWFYDYNLKGERDSIVVIGNIHENQDIY
ncbi:YopX family protein [Sulfurovum sp.]|uniref:YopX family protein n=1 Tax=Sulfurovum sp. TaxID=1969726 RepID=UPI00356A1FF0